MIGEHQLISAGKNQVKNDTKKKKIQQMNIANQLLKTCLKHHFGVDGKEISKLSQKIGCIATVG